MGSHSWFSGSAINAACSLSPGSGWLHSTATIVLAGVQLTWHLLSVWVSSVTGLHVLGALQELWLCYLVSSLSFSLWPLQIPGASTSAEATHSLLTFPGLSQHTVSALLQLTFMPSKLRLPGKLTLCPVWLLAQGKSLAPSGPQLLCTCPMEALPRIFYFSDAALLLITAGWLVGWLVFSPSIIFQVPTAVHKLWWALLHGLSYPEFQSFHSPP